MLASANCVMTFVFDRFVLRELAAIEMVTAAVNYTRFLYGQHILLCAVRVFLCSQDQFPRPFT